MNNIAVLLDLDNIKPQLSEIETLCAEYGTLIERRAFCNTPAVLTAYGNAFREFKYRFELTPGLATVPQEVDHLIIQTTRELIENPKSDIKLIAIVSNDNGYARLFKDLKLKGIKTLVIGNQIGNQLRETADHVRLLQGIIQPIYMGIDLGTTNTVIARANLNLATQQWTATELSIPIKNEQGSLFNQSMIPSHIRFNSKTEAEVGQHIKAQYYAFSDKTILSWKHNMGVSINNKSFTYQLSSGNILPEEAASKILLHCRNELSKRYNEMQGVVITHPASYESDAIEATRKAAMLAGWEEEEIVLLAEPQAALYDFLYRIQKGEIHQVFDLNQPCNILVYDLGGGTLDITLHNIQWNSSKAEFIIQDLAIGSRTRVGGDVVDQLIADYILQNAPHVKNLPEGERKKLRYELEVYAEKFKKTWGSEYTYSSQKQNFQYSFQGGFLNGDCPILYYISSKKMQEILSPLLCEDLSLDLLETLNPETAFNESPFTDRFNTFVVPILEVLLKAKQNLGEIPPIDFILLNGGMTYFPPIRERLGKLFGKVPLLEENQPDVAVARGAALYAAGALKSVDRINPNNIHLEVSDQGKNNLRLLIKQGQKYPYKTIFKGFKLPNQESGYLGFNIWVGMGDKPNVNTKLQRQRQVNLEEIKQANLSPGCLLDIEIEYTFDERLLLTLISESGGRFKLAVDSEIVSIADKEKTKETRPLTSSFSEAEITIPTLDRKRSGQGIIPGIRVKFSEWEALAKSLNNNWNNGHFQDRFRELRIRTKTCENRQEIINHLLGWLESGQILETSTSGIKTLMAVRGLTEIFETISTDDSLASGLETRYQRWIKQKFETGLHQLSNTLFTDIAETPGKLLWRGFDQHLITAFKRYERQPQALSFLNSLAKCGKPTENSLDILHHVIKTSPHIGQREKAAWALGRLMSPGQPEEWKPQFEDVEKAAKLALNQLFKSEKKPQVATNLLGCLYLCILWKIKGKDLSDEIYQQLEQLPSRSLAVDQQLQGYPQIKATFEERLELLPKLLNSQNISQEDIKKINVFILEVS